MVSDFEQLIRLLTRHNVEFVIVGGLAATIHGAATVTYDLDICYRRSNENIERLCRALFSIRPRLRGAPEGLPFTLDPPTVMAGFNFTLSTDLGPLDLLAEITPIGQYDRVVENAQTVHLFGCEVRVLSLRALIAAKRSTGRNKDAIAVLELEQLLKAQERESRDPPAEP
jgi:predicted nucleotidyltransferase